MARLIQNLDAEDDLLRRHGLTRSEFTGALPMAVEALRGSASASNAERRKFLTTLFEAMRAQGLITALELPTYGDDTVYKLGVERLGNVAIIQKGCPDGAHSSVNWTIPDWADEAYLWWVCHSQNAHPGEHVAKGVNRLRQRFFSNRPGKLDGIVFHSALCGSPQRPCPKEARSAQLSLGVTPPPCVYIMPGAEPEGDSWNWHGDRVRTFPNVLLKFFGIAPDLAPLYVGHVGFRQRTGSLDTVIKSNFGPGRTTSHRS